MGGTDVDVLRHARQGAEAGEGSARPSSAADTERDPSIVRRLERRVAADQPARYERGLRSLGAAAS